jgi:hypothetical protein
MDGEGQGSWATANRDRGGVAECGGRFHLLGLAAGQASRRLPLTVPPVVESAGCGHMLSTTSPTTSGPEPPT